MTLSSLQLITALVATAAIIVWVTVAYNKLQTRAQTVIEAQSNLYVSLQERYNLITRLFEATKAAINYERSLQESVGLLRNNIAKNNLDVAEVNSKSNSLEAQLKGQFIAKIESYPDLLANASVRNLFDSLKDTEDDVAGSRLLYNHAVMMYSDYYKSIPQILVARSFGYKLPSFFDTTPAMVPQPDSDSTEK